MPYPGRGDRVSAVKLTVIEESDCWDGRWAFRVAGVDDLDPRDLATGDRVRIGDSEYSVLGTYGTRGAGQPFSVLVEDRVIIE